MRAFLFLQSFLFVRTKQKILKDIICAFSDATAMRYLPCFDFYCFSFSHKIILNSKDFASNIYKNKTCVIHFNI